MSEDRPRLYAERGNPGAVYEAVDVGRPDAADWVALIECEGIAVVRHVGEPGEIVLKTASDLVPLSARADEAGARLTPGKRNPRGQPASGVPQRQDRGGGPSQRNTMRSPSR